MGAAHMASRILAPALIAALAAAAQAAWAEDGLLPFPGAAGEARQAGLPDETARPEPGIASPEPAAAAAGEPAVTAGGSRLLRMLAETPAGPASRDDGVAGGAPLSGPGVSGARVTGARVFAAEGCPRALLRRLLAGAAGEADALSALGIEREILSLCRERQEILTGLFEAEAALRELRTVRAAPTAAAVPAPATRIAAPVRRAAPSPLREALTASAKKADEADARAVEPRMPRYAWFSIVGSGGALRAGVTDGAQVWFVREGDPLPGGARVAGIAARPPGVRVTGEGGNGGAVLLPYAGTDVSGTSVSGTGVRARPGGAP